MLARPSLFAVAAIAVLATAFSPSTSAQSLPAEYATIDIRLAEETIRMLADGSPEERSRAVASVEAQPGKFAPPVLFAVSKALFDAGRKDDAAFWFYAGQLRTRIDANRCADPTAKQAATALSRAYGPPINGYTRKNLPMLEKLVPKVVEWDRHTPREYDHRWINRHGMDAILAAEGEPGDRAGRRPLSVPAGQWPAIEEETRATYLRGFHDALERLKKESRD